MKILLDECLDRRLAIELADFDVTTVAKHGWSGIKNGKLLELAEEEFDIFITVDRNLTFQQNLSTSRLSIIVLSDHGTNVNTLRSIIPQLIDTIGSIFRGDIVWVGKHSVE